MKYISISKLKLAAADLSLKTSVLVKKELEFDDAVEYYWTDSQVMIGYRRDTQKRIKVFVANEVQQMRESSDVLH